MGGGVYTLYVDVHLDCTVITDFLQLADCRRGACPYKPNVIFTNALRMVCECMANVSG